MMARGTGALSPTPRAPSPPRALPAPPSTLHLPPTALSSDAPTLPWPRAAPSARAPSPRTEPSLTLGAPPSPLLVSSLQLKKSASAYTRKPQRVGIRYAAENHRINAYLLRRVGRPRRRPGL